jgi:hypothetical protein
VKHARKPKRTNLAPPALCLLLAAGCFLCGCSVVEYLRPEEPPSDAELYTAYAQTSLKTSTAYDVLTTVHRPEYELLSQSESVIASSGQKRKGHEIWFNLVAFDETKLTASRKYILIADDRLNLMEEARQDLSFDCETVLDTKVLDEPYANENARRIAILKQARENTGRDIGEVASENKMLEICGMMINQAFAAALVELETSPALAWKLTDPAGAEFSHISLKRGRIQLLLDDDVAKVKMRLGRQVKIWEKRLKKAEKKT